MMSWPVFETNLPASEYRKVRRNNDYYDAEFYHVGIGFRKAILRQTGFGMCFLQE